MTSDYTFRFVRDKSEDGEFFLEIQPSGSSEGKKMRKRICIIDIDEIEPVQGTKFLLKYYQDPSMMSLNFNKGKMLKTETYQSKHLADILDCYEQVLKKIDEQQKELDAFIAMQESATTTKDNWK